MGVLSSGQRHAVLQAAIEELISVGIDGFSLRGVAKRAGVEPSLILTGWGDRRVLLMDAQLNYVRQAAPLPDTGTLRGDLDALAEAVSRLAATARGRMWVHRLLPADRSNIDLSEARTDFWTIQESNFCEVFDRARRRGELREDIDPLYATQLFKAAVYHDVVFADSPFRPEYIAQALDTFVRGVTSDGVDPG